MSIKVAIDERGFSMIEVIVAMSLFVIGTMGIMSSQVNTMRINSNTSFIAQGVELANRTVEELLQLDYDDAQLIDDNGGVAAAGLNDDTILTADESLQIVTAQNITYNIYWNIQNDYPVANTKTVNIIVTWQNWGVSKRTVMSFIKSSI